VTDWGNLPGALGFVAGTLILFLLGYGAARVQSFQKEETEKMHQELSSLQENRAELETLRGMVLELHAKLQSLFISFDMLKAKYELGRKETRGDETPKP